MANEFITLRNSALWPKKYYLIITELGEKYLSIVINIYHLFTIYYVPDVLLNALHIFCLIHMINLCAESLLIFFTNDTGLPIIINVNDVTRA